MERLQFNEVLLQPPYSPDLAPSDFFLFLRLKEHLGENNYADDAKVHIAVLAWFRKNTPDFFADGLQQLPKRWRLCVEVNEDYFEK